MMEITQYGTYIRFKQELDDELRRSAAGFVKIGYLLRLAQDTDVLKDSGYSNVNEFAYKEYGLDKSQVSRFMAINERFSEGGYSDRLQEKYEGYGVAKLGIMLQLPDAVNEEISPNYSKSEIQAIKDEVDEEKKVSDLEILMQGTNPATQEKNLLEKVVYQLLRDNRDLYKEIWENRRNYIGEEPVEHPSGQQPWAQTLYEILAPNEEATYNVLIMGVGRVMLSIKGLDVPITATTLRSNEKEKYDFDKMSEAIKELLIYDEKMAYQSSWSEIYHTDWPETTAEPERTTSNPQKTAKKKDTKVHKAKVEKPKTPEPEKKEKIAPVQQPEQVQLNDIDATIPAKDPLDPGKPTDENAENAINTKCEEDIPGQDTIMNHPEYLPEDMTEVIPPENAIKTECGENSTQVAGMEKLTDEEISDYWCRINENLSRAHLKVAEYTSKDVINGVLTAGEIKEAYDHMIKAAADMERILIDAERRIFRE